jgi:phosphoribosylanthranilate isomerase
LNFENHARNFEKSMTLSYPRIKICGLTRAQDLELLASTSADTVGINLVPTSPRRVSLETANELVGLTHALGLRATAVLMNPTRQLLQEVLDGADWDFVQLHGQETPELLETLGSLPIIKAISWSGRPEEAQLASLWSDWGRQQKARPCGIPTRQALAGYLVDAYAPTVGGGTGKTADWSQLSPRPEPLRTYPLILAGGLTPFNVRQAILATKCSGVDVASGVESAAGLKSAELALEFVAQAESGFLELTGKPLQ